MPKRRVPLVDKFAHNADHVPGAFEELRIDTPQEHRARQQEARRRTRLAGSSSDSSSSGVTVPVVIDSGTYRTKAALGNTSSSHSLPATPIC